MGDRWIVGESIDQRLPPRFVWEVRQELKVVKAVVGLRGIGWIPAGKTELGRHLESLLSGQISSEDLMRSSFVSFDLRSFGGDQ